MKNLKQEILIIILFMTIGIAAVTSNIVLSGSTTISNNPDDFLVYFSNYTDFGNESRNNYTDANVTIQSSNKITFSGTLDTVGETIAIDVDIANASKNYDANINLSCNTNSEYIDVVFGKTSNIIPSRGYINAGFEARLKKSYTGEEEINAEITCTFTATPVEKTTISNNTVQEPLSRTYFVGEEITIGTEKFNVISEDNSTVKLFAQYKLGTDYRQTTTENIVTFSEEYGWLTSPAEIDIDIQQYDGNAKTYINKYKEIIDTKLGITTTKADLISLKELEKLGCTIPDGYLYTTDITKRTCKNSPYISWINKSINWWTKSAAADNPYQNVWNYCDAKNFCSNHINIVQKGIRPVITIPKSALKKELISFGMGLYEYQAEKGMTWEQWIISNYNTDGFKNCDGFLCGSNDVNVIDQDWNSIPITDTIKENDELTVIS